MSAYDEEELCCLLLLCEEEQRLKKRRRWDVRPLNEGRAREGVFHTYIQKMRLLDKEKHHEYFCMSAEKFDELVRRISPLS